MSKKETRALQGIEVREAPEDSPFIGILEGYASVFNSDSVPFDGGRRDWVERVQPGAFARTLREKPDVKAFWSHRSDQILARAPETLTLMEDERGLKATIHLVDTQLNRDLLTQIRAGIVDAMSFGFTVNAQSWEKDDANHRDIRTVTDVELFEVSPVVFPAYPDTSIAVRSQEQFHEKEEQERTDAAPAEPFAPKRAAWRARLGN